MVMGMPQSDATANFYVVLREYARTLEPPLLVAAMLPIRFRPNPPGDRMEQLAPDVMVARAPDHFRSSYDVEREGGAPCFVLEVVSPESRQRDLRDKPAHYERMGVDEYALYIPASAGRPTALLGYRRDPPTNQPGAEDGRFVTWEPDGQGRLWSGQLGLWLALRDGDLRLQRADGSWLRTHTESEAAAQAAEAEVAQLRKALEQRREK